MAPHEGDTPPSWMDELACVFELAETLFEAGSTASVNIRRLKVVCVVVISKVLGLFSTPLIPGTKNLGSFTSIFYTPVGEFCGI